MSLNPIAATEAVREAYLSYLRTTFHLKDKRLRQQFEAQLRPEKLLKGPILEATPPFRTGNSIADLIGEGLLSGEFGRLDKALPLARALYRHQEAAIRKAVAARRNIVVATGTGSGKTEAFLVPVLEHLFRQHESGRLGPGVRALLLYPMNALANDQMQRLRQLLAECPYITFGRYTGETQRHRGPALQNYRRMFGRDPLPNELISREEMQRQPPHLLLTNYAMLEYLLLRPDDHVFFDGPLAGEWRFLVVDEVHVYSGAKGIETAMLLRRLRERVADGRKGRLQCIATSATVGREADFPHVAAFATRLFDEPFEWEEGDPGRQDVVWADREAPFSGPTWGRPAAELYETWQEILRGASSPEVVGRLLQAGQACGVPAEILDRSAQEAGGDVTRFLHAILKGDARLRSLQERLTQGPQYLKELAAHLFPADGGGQQTLAALVDLAARARPGPDDQPLLPARYHLFVRAVEGAFVAFTPEPHVFLERRESFIMGEDRHPVFELGACRQCGSAYLIGRSHPSDSRHVLRQPGPQAAENPTDVEYYLLASGAEPCPPDEDDDVVAGEEGDADGSQGYRLCVRCGGIGRRNLLGAICDCARPMLVDVLQVESADGQVRLCPACGKRSPESMVWRFVIGQDAAASVLATALHQQIPDRSRDNEGPSGPVDEWGSTAATSAETGEREPPGAGGRRMLVFSDSRQDAAFFAPYLERTYGQILQRRLMLSTLEQNRESVVRNRWRLPDLIRPLRLTAQRSGLFRDMSPQGEEAEVWKWVLQEFLALDRRNSLEGLGLLSFHVVQPAGWQPPRPLLAPPWSLSPDDVWALFEILLDGFRTRGAILFPDVVGPDDEAFAPRNRPYYFRADRSSAKAGVLSWNPTSRMNSRLDFLCRLAQRLGLDSSNEACLDVLQNIWSRSLRPEQRDGAWASHFVRRDVRGEGPVYQMRPDVWEIRLGDARSGGVWYRCTRCRSLWRLHVRGVCPTYRCDGELRACDPEEELADNHYRRLSQHLMPIPLRAEEHTAQLTPEAAFALQHDFVRGDVSVLSCSTTFELGVDVGELETVFMRNVPPSAANYLQRAGRAGRRKTATAFALTFAQRRSHDLTHLQEPLHLVSGTIRPPHVEVSNEKIVRRHVHAVALSAFWRQNREAYGEGKVDDFFFSTDGPERFRAFLDGRPGPVLTSLQRIVPAELQEALDLQGWGWVSALYHPREGPLVMAAEEVRHDVEQLERLREERFHRRQPVDHVSRMIRTIRTRRLIDFLASRNVLPKYGFPVDVVELRIQHHGEEADRLELTRDLRIALSEYAPSGEVVAGNRLWTSRYLRRLPMREWDRFSYAICPHCQCYQRDREELQTPFTDCRLCKRPLHGQGVQGRFLVPTFGFLTELGPPRRPGFRRPERTYTTRIFYSGEERPGTEVRIALGNGVEVAAIPAAAGRLAVINRAFRHGFQVCPACGFAAVAGERVPRPHRKPWDGGECTVGLVRYDLGHEFSTDILQLRFLGHPGAETGFWHSLLYSVLEGASKELAIERDDLDGCLYSYQGDPHRPALILFDDVPGGAGHVRRIAQGAETLRAVLAAALDHVRRCECGGEEGDASCYGCLRNYRNQFCHEELRRGPVVRFLEQALAQR